MADPHVASVLQLPLLLLQKVINRNNLRKVLLRVPVQEFILAEKVQRQEHEAAGQGITVRTETGVQLAFSLLCGPWNILHTVRVSLPTAALSKKLPHRHMQRTRSSLFKDSASCRLDHQC